MAAATVALGAPAPAYAAGPAADMLTYEPYGLVHNLHSASEVDGYLADLDAYGIGQALLQTPRFRSSGALHVPRHDRTMLARWVDRAARYNATHGTSIVVTAVFNGQVKTTGGGLELGDPSTRTRMIEGIESVLATGVSGVNLDLEPFPMTSGYIAFLTELGAMFTDVGFEGRLAVVSSGFPTKWSPSYLRKVSRLVDQIDPMFYDSEFKSGDAYQSWIVDSLAYYAANVRAGTRIVPVLPSYSANPWHRPNVENIATASAALSAALDDGSRVNGAGIWWWWGFFYNEDGAYDAKADRAAWQSTTVALPFSR